MDIDMHNLMYLSREKITPDHVQFFVYQVKAISPPSHSPPLPPSHPPFLLLFPTPWIRSEPLFSPLFPPSSVLQVLCGIKYMHALNIIHRDLKVLATTLSFHFYPSLPSSLPPLLPLPI